MAPASTQKLITAITALARLPGGGDFRFQNSFKGVTASSDTILTGPEFEVSGDPTWGHKYYDNDNLLLRTDKIAAELKARGITKVVGEVKFTHLNSYLDKVSRVELELDGTWKKEWRTECYASLPTHITLAGNCATYVVTGKNSGRWIDPGVNLPVSVSVARVRKGIAVGGVPTLDDRGFATAYRVSGKTTRYPVSIEVPVQGNETWLKNLLALSLKKAGIEYKEKDADPTRDVSAVTPFAPIDVSSPPLREILIPFVQRSLNGIGDRLFLEIAGQANSLDRPSLPELQTMEELTGDHTLIASQSASPLTYSNPSLSDPTQSNAVVIVDGSGLSTPNRMKPGLMWKLLESVKPQNGADRVPYFKDFFASLSIAAKEGTLANATLHNLLRHPLTSGKIFGKTGTVNGVKNVVGYFQKPDQTLEAVVFYTKFRALSNSRVAHMTDSVLIEFARQNSGLEGFQNPVTTLKKPARKSAALSKPRH